MQLAIAWFLSYQVDSKCLHARHTCHILKLYKITIANELVTGPCNFEKTLPSACQNRSLSWYLAMYYSCIAGCINYY